MLYVCVDYSGIAAIAWGKNVFNNISGAQLLNKIIIYSREGEPDYKTKTTERYKIVFSNLTLFWRSLYSDLICAGYTDDTIRVLSSRIAGGKFRPQSKTFSYIANDKLDCFKIDIYINRNKRIEIVNGNKLVSNNNIKSVEELKRLSRAMFNACQEEWGLTSSSLAYRSIKKSISSLSWSNIMGDDSREMLPTGETVEEYLRQGYGAGLNILRRRGDYPEGIVLDVNSLYLYSLKTSLLPASSRPTMGIGKPPEELLKSDLYCAYIRIKVDCSIKDGYIPFLRSREAGVHLLLGIEPGAVIAHTVTDKNEHIKVECLLIKEEFNLLLEYYNIHEIEYIDYIYYIGARGIFEHWCDNVYFLKKNAETPELRAAYKAISVGAIGSMAKKRERINVVLDDSEGVKLFSVPSNSASNIHFASYIVNMAKVKIIKDAQAHYNRFIYTDTDSLHLTGLELPEDLEIGKELGQYKIEHEFNEAYYWDRKQYALDCEGRWNLTAVGLPEEGNAQAVKALEGETDTLTAASIPGWEKASNDLIELFNSESKRERLTAPELRYFKTFIPVKLHCQTETWKEKTEIVPWDFAPGYKQNILEMLNKIN